MIETVLLFVGSCMIVIVVGCFGLVGIPMWYVQILELWQWARDGFPRSTATGEGDKEFMWFMWFCQAMTLVLVGLIIAMAIAEFS